MWSLVGLPLLTGQLLAGLTWPLLARLTWPLQAGLTWPLLAGLTWPLLAGLTWPLQAVQAGNVKTSGARSVRDLARGAVLSSWPVGDKKVLAEMVSQYITQANSIDFDDCGKKLLCSLAGKNKGEMDWDEEMMVEAFSGPVDYSSTSVQFKVAVQIGKMDPENCVQVYPRCYLDLQELLKGMRQHGLSVEIPGTNRDCSIYFLWRKEKPVEEPENPQAALEGVEEGDGGGHNGDQTGDQTEDDAEDEDNQPVNEVEADGGA